MNSILKTIAAMTIGLSAVFMHSQATAAGANGKALYKAKNCITCHGKKGKSPLMAGYPKLAGQDKKYLVIQINDIKSGARSNSMTPVMKPNVAALSDEEISAIATYLSKQ
ncbi:MAG: cytochrome C [Alteromonadaceae bacterium]|nr:MAG: cytochrome C [Alteromonadaceae bacterium]